MTSPADEQYARFMGFAGMAADTNSPANLLKSTFERSRLEEAGLRRSVDQVSANSAPSG